MVLDVMHEEEAWEQIKPKEKRDRFEYWIRKYFETEENTLAFIMRKYAIGVLEIVHEGLRRGYTFVENNPPDGQYWQIAANSRDRYRWNDNVILSSFHDSKAKLSGFVWRAN